MQVICLWPQVHASMGHESLVLRLLFLLPAPSGGGERLAAQPTPPTNRQSRNAWRFLFLGSPNSPGPAMTAPIDDKTSLTDDERIENIVPLPPPENLIRFFPIQ